MTANSSINVFLLDIEGTTTPIDFVYKVLFPYARAHLREYLRTHLDEPELQPALSALLELNLKDTNRGLDPPGLVGPVRDVTVDEAVAYLHWLMDRDSKATPLKSIQGKIWEAGYSSGELISEVFEDVPRAFERWRANGKRICIYSSGSVLAQRLLFSSTQLGDLTTCIAEYFDTNVGAKREPESYRRISAALGVPGSEILFISDVTEELDAAASAGLETCLCVRPGNHPQSEASNYRVIHSFDQVP